MNTLALWFLALALLSWQSYPLAGRVQNEGEGHQESATKVSLPRTCGLLAAARDLELFLVCAQAGLTSAQAAKAVSEQSPFSQWATTASLLQLGMHPMQAWKPLEAVPALESLTLITRNSQRSGAAVSQGLGRLAQRLYQEAESQAVADSERANVLIAVPLTLCFLPAFVILGLLPIIVSFVLNLSF